VSSEAFSVATTAFNIPYLSCIAFLVKLCYNEEYNESMIRHSPDTHASWHDGWDGEEEGKEEEKTE
jgi:hypothetical protein